MPITQSRMMAVIEAAYAAQQTILRAQDFARQGDLETLAAYILSASPSPAHSALLATEIAHFRHAKRDNDRRRARQATKRGSPT